MPGYKNRSPCYIFENRWCTINAMTLNPQMKRFYLFSQSLFDNAIASPLMITFHKGKKKSRRLVLQHWTFCLRGCDRSPPDAFVQSISFCSAQSLEWVNHKSPLFRDFIDSQRHVEVVYWWCDSIGLHGTLVSRPSLTEELGSERNGLWACRFDSEQQTTATVVKRQWRSFVKIKKN